MFRALVPTKKAVARTRRVLANCMFASELLEEGIAMRFWVKTVV